MNLNDKHGHLISVGAHVKHADGRVTKVVGTMQSHATPQSVLQPQIDVAHARDLEIVTHGAKADGDDKDGTIVWD